MKHLCCSPGRQLVKPKLFQFVFDSCGIPVHIWEEKQLDIESALNISIVSIKYGKDKRKIHINAVPAKGALPEFVDWNDDYLASKDSVVNLGLGLAGSVSADLAIQPHIYIGGDSGSGKSTLFKNTLWQLMQHEHTVFICDLKGGADFGPMWRERFHMIFDDHAMRAVLAGITEELKSRRELFGKHGYANIDEYCRITGATMRRIIIGIDEVAEVFGRAATKEQKEILWEIEDQLSLIARQGRAFGIHLVLSTQRGDANILPAQIRSNLSIKIAGRCDAVLSQIIIDSTDAAKMIPKEARGRFLRNDGVLFQGFYMEEIFEI